jgi:hypothetical protein
MTHAERQDKMAAVERCKRVGEAAYDRMYDVRDDGELRFQAELAADSYADASRIARELGIEDEAAASLERAAHIRAVARQLR